jgi:hypothetical protein
VREAVEEGRCWARFLALLAPLLLLIARFLKPLPTGLRHGFGLSIFGTLAAVFYKRHLLAILCVAPL